MPIDGVDTTRERGKLMVYTPSYFIDSDTAPGGVEWMLMSAPPTALPGAEIRHDAGHTPIPPGARCSRSAASSCPKRWRRWRRSTRVTLARSGQPCTARRPIAWRRPITS